MSDWQPIETAPRIQDQDIIAWHKGGYPVVVWWDWRFNGKPRSCDRPWSTSDFSYPTECLTHWLPFTPPAQV